MEDDLTWCIQKAKSFPKFAQIALIGTPEAWFGIIFGYGYISGFLLYIMIQFDKEYKRKNCRDWHYTTWLVALPACIGISPRFYPKDYRVRVFYAFMLVTATFFFQMGFCYVYRFLKLPVFHRQISSVDELVENNFRLMGSKYVLDAIYDDKKVKIESNVLSQMFFFFSIQEMDQYIRL